MARSAGFTSLPAQVRGIGARADTLGVSSSSFVADIAAFFLASDIRTADVSYLNFVEKRTGTFARVNDA